MLRNESHTEAKKVSRRTLLKFAPLSAVVLATRPLLSVADSITASTFNIGFTSTGGQDEGPLMLRPAHELSSSLDVYADGAEIFVSAQMGDDVNDFTSVSFELYQDLNASTGLRQLLWTFSNQPVETKSASVSFFSPLINGTLSLHLVTRISFKDSRPDLTTSEEITFSSQIVDQQSNRLPLHDGHYLIPLMPDESFRWSDYGASASTMTDPLYIEPLDNGLKVSRSFLEVRVSNPSMSLESEAKENAAENPDV